MEPTSRFNLLHEPFIPVVGAHANVRSRNGIGTLLTNARDFRCIHHPSPLVTVACYRLLLALLQRVFGAQVAEHGAAWWVAGRFPTEPLNDYFARWGGRFDLFDPERPFLQVADLLPEVSRLPWTALAAEKASGNNNTLFDHALDTQPDPLPLTDAALYLLAAQATALGGGKSIYGLPNLANATSAAAVLAIVSGDNLFQTLLLNLLPQTTAQHAQDLATWERKEPATIERVRLNQVHGYRGPAQLYSLPARSIRLFADPGNTTISHIGLASGERLKEAEGRDPMVSYRADAERGLRPLQLHSERAFWRDLHALQPRSATGHRTSDHAPPAVLTAAATLLSGVRSGLKPRLTVFGQCTDQAKVELWRCESLPLPQALLSDSDAWDSIRNALALAEKHANILSKANYRLVHEQKAGVIDPDRKAVRALASTFPMLPAYWAALGAAFNEWIATLGEDDSDTAESRWHQAVAQALHQAWHLAERMVPLTHRGDRALFQAEKGIRKALKILTPKTHPMEYVA